MKEINVMVPSEERQDEEDGWETVSGDRDKS